MASRLVPREWLSLTRPIEDDGRSQPVHDHQTRRPLGATRHSDGGETQVDARDPKPSPRVATQQTSVCAQLGGPGCVDRGEQLRLAQPPGDRAATVDRLEYGGPVPVDPRRLCGGEIGRGGTVERRVRRPRHDTGFSRLAGQLEAETEDNAPRRQPPRPRSGADHQHRPTRAAVGECWSWILIGGPCAKPAGNRVTTFCVVHRPGCDLVPAALCSRANLCKNAPKLCNLLRRRHEPLSAPYSEDLRSHEAWFGRIEASRGLTSAHPRAESRRTLGGPPGPEERGSTL